MNTLKKSIAIVSYLFLIAALAKFQLYKLFDIKQIIVTCAGAYLLYIPANGFSIKKNPSMLGNTALIASYIQTFVLVFFYMLNAKDLEHILENMAYSCRPLFYGFFLWVILQGKESRKNKEEDEAKDEAAKESGVTEVTTVYSEEITAETMHIRLKRFGLTDREVEVALEICKGLSNAEVADKLYISETTVKKHLSNIFEKMGISKRGQIEEKIHSDSVM